MRGQTALRSERITDPLAAFHSSEKNRLGFRLCSREFFERFRWKLTNFSYDLRGEPSRDYRRRWVRVSGSLGECLCDVFGVARCYLVSCPPSGSYSCRGGDLGGPERCHVGTDAPQHSDKPTPDGEKMRTQIVPGVRGTRAGWGRE